MTAPPAPGSRRARLARELKARALREGFHFCGITSPRPSEHARFYEGWTAHGYHGEMAYLARPDATLRRSDLALTLPRVRSVLVVAHEYGGEDEGVSAVDPARGVIARYARGRDYHRVVKKRLLRLLSWLRAAASESGLADEVRGAAYVDTGPVLERDLGRRAGLGWFGKNTMLIHPARGSWFFLGVLLVDLELPVDSPFEGDRCGSCRRCLDACPTGALLGRDGDGAPVLDARVCISYLTIELRGPIPRRLRPSIGNRIFGCDICQEVCPYTHKFSRPSQEPDYAARGPGLVQVESDADGESVPGSRSYPGTEGPRLVDLMRMDELAWDAFTRGSAIRRAGYGGLRRNLAIALGNWLAESDEPDPDAVDELVAALSDEDEVVAESAAWALRRAGL